MGTRERERRVTHERVVLLANRAPGSLRVGLHARLVSSVEADLSPCAVSPHLLHEACEAVEPIELTRAAHDTPTGASNASTATSPFAPPGVAWPSQYQCPSSTAHEALLQSSISQRSYAGPSLSNCTRNT